MYFACFLLVVLLASATVKCVYENRSSHDWDIIVYTQRWPITACHEWQQKSDKNTCTFPPLVDIWTIHGLWPTKFGTNGPNFCDDSLPFDPTKLKPIDNQLRIYWTNVEKNTPETSLWKHEWLKHGTCAVSLPELDDEAKYFGQGLDWIGKYDMKYVLSKGNVVPDQALTYKVADMYSTIKGYLKSSPRIECFIDKNGDSYVSEIRICFDKSLQLTDCDGKSHDGVNTNCDLSKSIIYTNVVPKPVREHHVPWQINLYRLLQFLIWFTL